VDRKLARNAALLGAMPLVAGPGRQTGLFDPSRARRTNPRIIGAVSLRRGIPVANGGGDHAIPGMNSCNPA